MMHKHAAASAGAGSMLPHGAMRRMLLLTGLLGPLLSERRVEASEGECALQRRARGGYSFSVPEDWRQSLARGVGEVWASPSDGTFNMNVVSVVAPEGPPFADAAGAAEAVLRRASSAQGVEQASLVTPPRTILRSRGNGDASGDLTDKVFVIEVAVKRRSESESERSATFFSSFGSGSGRVYVQTVQLPANAQEGAAACARSMADSFMQ
eukprot:gnl/TRDRNA2_/TRDRNA2_145402_c1_seq2.p1 gnl/TRDRNA2_/TRDRNA2_145402_c1~~gnl/TRDRNA2_/TRDRNA2_145402_c1_seq2.p1  ORF type:complete len:246 (+),score=43.11 gnl/TRDRNA2_/TRDRNA2_145402_c1_seq2:109-738(+)